MTNDITPMWVAPEFKRKLKIDAAQQGISVIELSRRLSQDTEQATQNMGKNNVKKLRPFEFKM